MSEDEIKAHFRDLLPGDSIEIAAINRCFDISTVVKKHKKLDELKDWEGKLIKYCNLNKNNPTIRQLKYVDGLPNVSLPKSHYKISEIKTCC